MKKRLFTSLLFCSVLFYNGFSQTQVLTLKDAMNQSLTNYGSIKAKENYVNASKASLQQTKRDYLPNFILSAQQDYGTVNGQNGPLYGYGGYGVASSGLPLNAQNWNAGFGALYLANVNWEFFTFGKTKEKISIAKNTVQRDQNDLAQEQFQHQVKVAATYLNLLASQRIVHSQQQNLDRAIIFKNNTITRARNGLIAGVDSSLANAEVSNAKIALTKAKDLEQEQAKNLAVLIGAPYANFMLDTGFVAHPPKTILTPSAISKTHPLLNYYQSRINLGNEQISYSRKFYYPSFSMFGIMQERGSGFQAAYTQNQNAFTKDYGTGVNPTRGNYLLGVGMTWNLTSISRNTAQVKSQQFILDALKNEYDLTNQQLKAQLAMADDKVKNALDNYNEAPVQVKAASDAYTQKLTLYKNGLATIVEVTQTLYALNRAETDRDIAFTNLWQALLLKAASSGELPLFTNEF